MHTEKREDPLVEMGYEIRDINVPGIRKSVVWFLGFAVFCSIAGGIILSWIRGSVVSHDQTQSLLSRRELPPSPNPLLQNNISAKTDIMVLRQTEDTILYGPPTVNKDGTMRIPINEAMAIIAARAASSGGSNAKVNANMTGNTAGYPAGTTGSSRAGGLEMSSRLAAPQALGRSPGATGEKPILAPNATSSPKQDLSGKVTTKSQPAPAPQALTRKVQ